MGVLGADAAVERLVAEVGLRPDGIHGGSAELRAAGLLRLLVIEKPRGKPTRLAWRVRIVDEELCGRLQDPMIGFEVDVVFSGHISDSDDLIKDYRWPTTDKPLDSDLIHDLAQFGSAAINFIGSRRELAEVLLVDGTMSRDGLAVTQRPVSSAARLVQALVIARRIGDADVERSALAKLEQQGDQMDSSGNTFRQLVGYYAAVYRPLVPADLADIAAAKAVLTIHWDF